MANAVHDDGDALARACAAAMLARDRASQALGISIELVRPGYAQITMQVGEAMINGHATAHGGVIFTLADTAFALACNSRDVPHVALEASISFTSPAKLGERLRAVAVERSLRGRTGVYEVAITNADDELVGIFRGTAYRIRGSVLAGAV